MKDFTNLFRLKYIGVFSAVIASLVFFSFISNASTYGIADRSTIKNWIERGALIVDVRTVEEFNAGNYKTSINIPLAGLEQNITRFGEKEKLIVVYCRSGNRSSQAKLILEKYGYKNVLNGGALVNMP
jgi:phage shock protein E